MLKFKKEKIMKFSTEYLFFLTTSYIFFEIVVYRKTAFSKDFFTTIPFVLILYLGGIFIFSITSHWVEFGSSDESESSFRDQGD
jgi:hypothetical protein